MTVANQILLWLADGAHQRIDLEIRAREAFRIRDGAATTTRVSSAIITLTRRGLVCMHPVRGFCLTPAGRAAIKEDLP